MELPDPSRFPLNHSKKERGTQPMTNERLGLDLARLWPWWGHSPKQRLICRYRMPPHALHTPYNLSPHTLHHQRSPGNCKALQQYKSISYVLKKIIILPTLYLLCLFFTVETGNISNRYCFLFFFSLKYPYLI